MGVVSRIFAESENYGLNLILDVNSELYPLNQKDKFTLILARSLQSDGMGGASGMPVEAGYYDAGRGRSMADDYEYVMYGKVYKFDESQNQQRVYVHCIFLYLYFHIRVITRCVPLFLLHVHGV